ncbi:energy transducer TonB [Mucilaginibacter sp. dw_454]|uniref:energy transducer TonB n=1 Tax=Mucilaginibacter sp. dw_454 TaxID=2720079 RepID=UPI001BD3864D|nr:energy transducer TonB [Mucilaginibacter sp. dw_454]
MKNLLALSFLFLFSLHAIAQKTYTLKRDTINLRGYVYNNDGTPAVRVWVSSKGRDFDNNLNFLYSGTDSAGYFAIKGASFNDTLTVDDKRFTSPPNYYNHGSRYLIIYLPAPKTIDLNKKDSVIITAKRRHRKVMPSFKIISSSNARIIDNIERFPEYPGDNDHFLAYIKQHLTYPEQAIQNNIEGEVKIQFTVERDGTLIHFKILQGIGYGCDEELLNILKGAPRWKPGILDNWPIAVYHTVTVKFSLTN